MQDKKIIAGDIAQKVWDELNSIIPLPEKGIYAGQAVASVYQKVIGHEIEGPINDIDRFVLVSQEMANAIEDYIKIEDYAKKKKIKEELKIIEDMEFEDDRHLLKGAGPVTERYDSYSYTYFFVREKGYCSILGSRRNGLLNSVYFSLTSRAKRKDRIEWTAAMLLNTFDLNCTRAAIMLKNGSPILVLDKYYLEFLQSKELRMEFFESALSSLMRGEKKVREFKGAKVFFKGDELLAAIRKLVREAHSPTTDELRVANNLVRVWVSEHFQFWKMNGWTVDNVNNELRKTLDFRKKHKLEEKEVIDISVYFQSNISPDIHKYLLQLAGYNYGLNKSKMRLIKELVEADLYSMVSHVDIFLNRGWDANKINNMAKKAEQHQKLIDFLGLYPEVLDFVAWAGKDQGPIGILEAFSNFDARKVLFNPHHEKQIIMEYFQKGEFEKGVEHVKTVMENVIQDEKVGRRGLEELKNFVPSKIGKVNIEMIITPEGLSKLGREEHHCVGGYWTNVLLQESIILKLSEGGKKVTTLELSHRKDKYGEYYWPNQHHSAFNKKLYTEERENIVREMGELFSRVQFGESGVIAWKKRRMAEKTNNRIKSPIDGMDYCFF